MKFRTCIPAILMASALALTGCATITEGTNQNIAVNTNPSGADCALYRQGLRIGTITQAPGSALVNKTKHDIWIVCAKQGYQQATYLNHSGVAGGTFGNIILGGGIGWAIDSAAGADNKYDSPVNLSMVPLVTGSTDKGGELPSTFNGS